MEEEYGAELKIIKLDTDSPVELEVKIDFPNNEFRYFYFDLEDLEDSIREFVKEQSVKVELENFE